MSSASPTRVAQVVRPAQGGIRRHVSLLINGLDRASYRCTVYAPSGFTLDRVLDVDGTVIVPVEITAKISVRQDFRAIGSLSKQLTGTCDLVHAHGIRAAMVAIPAARRVRVPSLFTAHNLPPTLNAIQRFALLWIARQCMAVIVVSGAVANSLQRIGVEQGLIHIVPNGIPLADYGTVEPADRSQFVAMTAGPVITCIGRLSPEKGVDTLLDAYREVKERMPNTHLLIVGSGPDEAQLRRTAASLMDVHFTGNRDDVPALLALSTLVVMPSRSEGQGIVALEAMASSLPVVATNVGGLAETVIDGITGLLVPAADSHSLSDAILTILQDRALGVRMGAAGRARVVAQYSITDMVGAIQDIYADSQVARA